MSQPNEIEKIPTAEEILAKRITKFPSDPETPYTGVAAMTDESIRRNVVAAMEEYATAKSTFHVQAALEAVHKNVKPRRESIGSPHVIVSPFIYKEDILNAYPLTNIK